MTGPARECETHVLKDPDELKKTLKPLPENSRHNDTFSPMGGGCREHPAEVRRRNDRNVRAEPPPPPPVQARTTKGAKSNRGRKRQANGFDDGDGSDSDRDSSHRTVGERDGSVTVRKKIQPPLTPKRNAAQPSTSMLLTPEELERVELQRKITRQRETDEGGWQGLLSARRRNRERTERNKHRMLRTLRDDPRGQRCIYANSSEATPPKKRQPNTHTFRLQELRTRDYLDEALCCDMEDTDLLKDDDCFLKGISEPELLESIIKEAEGQFVIWGEQFVIPSELTMQGVVKGLWEQNTWLVEFGEQVPDCTSTARASFTRKERIDLGSTTFFDAYRGRIMTSLGFSVVYRQRKRGWQASTRDQSKCLETIDILNNSRATGSLRREYIEWVCQGIPHNLIDSYCQQRLRQIRGKKTRQVLGSRSVTQEFCQDIDNQALSLVLFKGGIPCSIKPVSSFDRERLGWCKVPDGKRRGDSIFYRHEYDQRLGFRFKVGVNGELLGLWSPWGDADWKGDGEDIDTASARHPGASPPKNWRFGTRELRANPVVPF